MEPDRRSALEAARIRASEGLSRFARLPGALRLAYAAIPVLVLGALMPWVDFGSDATLGIEIVPGGIVLAIAVALVIALAPLGSEGGKADSGAVAALALLALGVVGAEFLSVVTKDFFGPAYGLYVTGAAAVVLLGAGVLLFGGAGTEGSEPPDRGGESPLPPPD